MDRARDFHFVKQLPRTNCAEVEYSDDVYDRQVLLNESWAIFGARNAFPADVQEEEHVKWVTETWQEYLDRVPQRSAALQAYFQGVSDIAAQRNLATAETKRRCDGTVARLMEQEKSFNAAKLGTLHTLYVDFEAELLKKHACQRADCEAAEAAARLANEDEEEKARAELRRLANEGKAAVQAILDEQRRKQEEEEARIKEEQRQKADELRKIEEEKQRLLDEAERKKREEEEEAKRAERRKKEEDRRAKAKAEREARGGRGAAGRAGGATQTKEEQRAAARATRWARMNNEMISYLDDLQPRCDAVDSNDKMQELYKAVADDLGGKLLFGTAVYVAVPQPLASSEDGAAATSAITSNDEVSSVRYVHASSNCSELLKSGDAVLAKDDSRADGIAPVTFDSCISKTKATGIIRHAEKQLVNVGNTSPEQLGTGDFMAAPIVNSKTGLVTAIIASDTMTGNPQDHAETFANNSSSLATEEHCYLKENVSDNDDTLYIAMPEQQGTFLEKVAECLATAETRIGGSGACDNQNNTDTNTTDNVVTANGTGEEKQQEEGEDTEGAEEETKKKTSGVAELKIDSNSVTSLPQLFQILTDHLHKNTTIEGTDAKLNVYISRLFKPNGAEATIVAHNGVLLNDPNRHTADVPCHLLGESLKEAKSLSFTTFHNQQAEPTHAYVPNVTGDDRVVLYQQGKIAVKQEECLLLVPLKDKKERVIAIVGCSCPAPPGLSEDLIKEILAMIHGQSTVLQRLLLRSHLSQLCAQACEWIEVTTGAPNVYISLKESALQGGGTGVTGTEAGGGGSHGDSLHYVAASGTQQWMIGKVLPAGEVGVSHAILNAPGATTEGHAINIASVAAFKHEATGSTVHCFGEGAGQDGSLVTCPIAYGGEAFGLVYADTVGPSASGSKKKTFTKSDEDLMKTTGQLLGGLMGEILYGRPATPGNDKEDALAKRVLSIEDLVGLEHIEFLKRVWVQVSGNIQNIKKDQLLEMSKYNTPPPVIPIVVGATFIVMGAKPKSVEKWEDCRKKIKFTILEKIINYDPTGTKVKKPFFQRARKMTKGHTADDVFTKGSYPASCFFTWTFVTILLRKSSDALRKKVKSGELDLSKPGSAGDDATESMATDDTMGDDLGDDMEMEMEDEAEPEGGDQEAEEEAVDGGAAAETAGGDDDAQEAGEEA